MFCQGVNLLLSRNDLIEIIIFYTPQQSTAWRPWLRIIGEWKSHGDAKCIHPNFGQYCKLEVRTWCEVHSNRIHDWSEVTSGDALLSCFLCYPICNSEFFSEFKIVLFSWNIFSWFLFFFHVSGSAAPPSPGRTAVHRMPVNTAAPPPPAAGITGTAHWKSEHDAKYTPIVYLQSPRYLLHMISL